MTNDDILTHVIFSTDSKRSSHKRSHKTSPSRANPQYTGGPKISQKSPNDVQIDILEYIAALAAVSVSKGQVFQKTMPPISTYPTMVSTVTPRQHQDRVRSRPTQLLFVSVVLLLLTNHASPALGLLPTAVRRRKLPVQRLRVSAFHLPSHTRLQMQPNDNDNQNKAQPSNDPERPPDFVRRRDFLDSALTITTMTAMLASASAEATGAPNITIGLSADRTDMSSTKSTTIPTKTVTSQQSLSSSRRMQQESISGFVAGGALTAMKTLVKYPLDTITVRLQMPQQSSSVGVSSSVSVSSSWLTPNTTETTTTTADTTTASSNRKNINHHSSNWLFQDVFVGIANPLLVNIPGGAVFFAVKDAIQTYLQQDLHWSKWEATLVSVLVANFPYWVIRNPSEVIKTKQQAAAAIIINDGTSVGVVEENTTAMIDTGGEDDDEVMASQTTPTTTAWQAFRMEYQQNGIAGFYVGYWENIVYAYPADVLKFWIYNQLWSTTTTAIISAGGSDASDSTIMLGSWILMTIHNLPPLVGASMAGAISTAVAQYITTPLDVVRNRVMTQTTTTTPTATTTTKIHINDTTSTTTTTPTNTTTNPLVGYLDAFVQIRENEGMVALFRGSIPRVGKALLSGAIQFATYEETKQQILQLFVGEINK